MNKHPLASDGLTAEELKEIAAQAVPDQYGRTLDAAQAASAWAAEVHKIDRDRALPWEDRSVWNEHDLAGALFLRDRVEQTLLALTPELAQRLRPYLDSVDEHFRSFTVADSGDRMAQIAQVDMAGRGWWWFRVPADGPIAQDLMRY